MKLMEPIPDIPFPQPVDRLTVLPKRQSPKTRITIVNSAYFQPVDGDPKLFDRKWSQALTTDEEPYQRKMKVGEEWQPLESGWLNGEASLLVIQNLKPRFDHNLSEAELKEVEEKAVELGSALYTDQKSVQVFSTVSVGRDVQIEPIGRLMIRCAKGEAQVQYTFYPK